MGYGECGAGREGRILLGRVVLPKHWTRLPFLLIPMSGGVLVFRYASHSGVSSAGQAWTPDPRGSSGSGGNKCDDGVASIGDRTGVTGALAFGANVSRSNCSQPGSAVTSGVSLGTVVAGRGIITGVEVDGARGMSSGRSVPGVNELVGVGALQHSTPGESLTWTALF